MRVGQGRLPCSESGAVIIDPTAFFLPLFLFLLFPLAAAAAAQIPRDSALHYSNSFLSLSFFFSLYFCTQQRCNGEKEIKKKRRREIKTYITLFTLKGLQHHHHHRDSLNVQQNIGVVNQNSVGCFRRWTGRGIRVTAAAIYSAPIDSLL